MDLKWDKLPKYFARCLDVIPEHMASYDPLRMMILYFSLAGFDVLNKLEQYVTLSDNRAKIIDWIYDQQILPSDDHDSKRRCGFRGSPFCKISHLGPNPGNKYDSSHVTMTYTALSCLFMLGDDLSRLNRDGVLAGVAALQNPQSGCFYNSLHAGEEDLRFIFSACAVCYYLNGFNVIDQEGVVSYIRQCESYDGGFGQRPGSESHGGSAFLAVASLWLMGRLDEELSGQRKQRLIRWLVQRQSEALHGRINKVDDTCYTFWVGAALKILGAESLLDADAVYEYIVRAQDPFTGGLSKYAGTSDVDLLHTYLPLAGLGCLLPPAAEGAGDWRAHLQPIHAPLNITERVHRDVVKTKKGSAA